MPSPPTIVLREGFFTLDTFVNILKHSVFNPTVTLPAFLLLQYTPQGQTLLASLVRDYPTLFARFKYIVALGVLGRINRFLSWGADNNWKSSTFVPASEIVVVTGGSSGIGAQIVQELVSRGGIKAIVVLDLQELGYTPASNVHFFRVDLSSGDNIRAVTQRVQEEIGHPTVLINNAGICRGKTLLDASERDITLTFAVNTTAHFLLTKAFLPSMIAADHGHIVTVASIGGYLQSPRMVDYNASKAAAVAFHEGLGLELKFKYNAPKVRTTMVAQGLVKTPLFEGFKNDSKFMLPALLPETLAEAIVERVWTAQGGQVVLPKTYNVVMGARGWASWLHRGLLGSTKDLMTNYAGKQVMEIEEKP